MRICRTGPYRTCRISKAMTAKAVIQIEVPLPSNATKRNANGQTKSGLHRIFIPADYCLEGFFD